MAPSNPKATAVVDTKTTAKSSSEFRAARERLKQSDSPSGFSLKDAALHSSWHQHAKRIICMNPYPNGVTISEHVVDQKLPVHEQFLPNHFSLRYRDTRDFQLPPGNYQLFKENFEQGVEDYFRKLKQEGHLQSSVVYFGTAIDPFLGLQKKFDVVLYCLQLLGAYAPGLTVVQTRSPMIISALPIFKVAEDKTVVVIPLETRLESAVQKYTPGQPSIRDRLIAADGLRAQGIRVNLAASPILPYGEYYRDAWDFAEMLDKHADFISVGSLSSGHSGEEVELRALPLARRLEGDQKYKILRPHAYRHLYYVLSNTVPEKLALPAPRFGKGSQMDLFEPQVA